MLVRFYITLSLAVAAFSAVGILAPGVGELLLGILICGLALIAALLFYVLGKNPPTLIAPQASLCEPWPDAVVPEGLPIHDFLRVPPPTGLAFSSSPAANGPRF